MKLIISPAKKMREDTDFLCPRSQPEFLPKTRKLLEYCRSLSKEELQRLLCCGKGIADLSYQRFQAMDLDNALTPALLAFDGIQYQYMAPQLFTREQFRYAEDHLLILSGFYGVLRPFDGVCPYRLEMQAKVRTSFCRNLYEFWGGSLAEAVFRDTDVLIDLASQEYAKTVSPFVPKGKRCIKVTFGEIPCEAGRQGKSVEKGVYVKMARGEMVRFLADTQARDPEALKEFRGLGYRFCPEASAEEHYVFLRNGRNLS